MIQIYPHIRPIPVYNSIYTCTVPALIHPEAYFITSAHMQVYNIYLRKKKTKKKKNNDKKRSVFQIKQVWTTDIYLIKIFQMQAKYSRPHILLSSSRTRTLAAKPHYLVIEIKQHVVRFFFSFFFGYSFVVVALPLFHSVHSHILIYNDNFTKIHWFICGRMRLRARLVYDVWW